jgi:hypothetical protein
MKVSAESPNQTPTLTPAPGCIITPGSNGLCVQGQSMSFCYLLFLLGTLSRFHRADMDSIGQWRGVLPESPPTAPGMALSRRPPPANQKLGLQHQVYHSPSYHHPHPLLSFRVNRAGTLSMPLHSTALGGEHFGSDVLQVRQQRFTGYADPTGVPVGASDVISWTTMDINRRRRQELLLPLLLTRPPSFTSL